MTLTGHRVATLAIEKDRALVRYLVSLGAELVPEPKTLEDLKTISFLVDGVGLKKLQDLGWNRESIEQNYPNLIQISVSTFGSYGPRNHWQGSELVASAMSGTLRLTGDPDRRPVKEALDACTFHADMVAAMGAMTAFFEFKRNGVGQHVDISIQEVAFNRNVSSIQAWQFDRRKLQRVGGAINYGKSSARCIWALADGWCFHSLMTGRFGAPANQALSDWMDEVGVENPLRGADWLQYNRSALDPSTRKIWESAIEQFFKTRTKKEINLDGRRRGINACVAAEPDDVLHDPHLQERDFWQLGDAGIKLPTRFAKIQLGNKTEGIDGIKTSHRIGPLSGVRVLDFSWALVGSVTTKTLGDLGADIIKVESRTRPCLSRLDVQVSVSKLGNFDDKPWFSHLNTSKRSLSLDMKKPEAKEVLNPLLEWADIIVENFSPGTMAKLGLDYSSVAKINPGVVMLSGSVYGQSGPLSQEWGVDGTGAALSGRTYLTGWADRDPVIPGSVPYGDVVVPFVMAATGVAVLAQRNDSGCGAHIDASMYEICVQQMIKAIIDTQTNGRPIREGNADSDWYMQDVYPTLGTDRWIAISVRDELQWRQLCELANSDDISSWTANKNEFELMEQLQSIGIAAGVVQDIEDTYEQDPGLQARNALIQLSHPMLDDFLHINSPVIFSRSRFAPFRSPAIGEHNVEIAETISGLTKERINQLIDLGVFN